MDILIRQVIAVPHRRVQDQDIGHQLTALQVRREQHHLARLIMSHQNVPQLNHGAVTLNQNVPVLKVSGANPLLLVADTAIQQVIHVLFALPQISGTVMIRLPVKALQVNGQLLQAEVLADGVARNVHLAVSQHVKQKPTVVL